MAASSFGTLWVTPSPAQRRRGHVAALVCGLAALGLYFATCSRVVEWQDSGIHQYRILTGQLEHRWGLALTHPLHFWLGRAALAVPLGSPEFRLNFLASLWGAVGVGLLAATVFALTGRADAACLGAAVLAVSHSYWQMSAMTETYTLAGALLTLEWYLLTHYARTGRPQLLVAIFAANGLHVADHLFGLLSLVTYAVLALVRVARGRLRWVWLLGCGLVWAVASAPLWTLVLRYYAQTGSWKATLCSTFFGGTWAEPGWAAHVLNTRLTGGLVGIAALTLGYNFPSPAMPVALVGFLRSWRGPARTFRRVLLGQTAIFGVFLGRYPIVDLYTCFVPICLLVALWFGLGAARILERSSGRNARGAWLGVLLLSVVMPVAVYVGFPLVARERLWMRARLRDIPFREEYTHFFRPWRMVDHSPADFSRAILDTAGPGGWVLADPTTAYPVASTYRLHGGPGGVRIYDVHACINVPDWPNLSDEELATFLRAGGRVVVVPGPQEDKAWTPRFVLDKHDPQFLPFWAIRLPGAGQTDEHRVDSPPSGDGGP